MVQTKSSPHWCGLVQPEIVTIEGISFVQGKQATGKEGHRMEGKRTLIPLEHVAALVEFASEEEFWIEPQPKHIRPPDEARQNPVLTSHEQLTQQQHKQGGNGRHQRRGRFRGNRQHNDPRRGPG